MADQNRLRQPLDLAYAGDCAADPVPALWEKDEQYITEAGFIERFWLPIAVGVLAGWGGLSFLMFNAFGWWVLAAIFGVVAAGSAVAVVLVKAGSRSDDEAATYYSAKADSEASAETRFSKAA